MLRLPHFLDNWLIWNLEGPDFGQDVFKYQCRNRYYFVSYTPEDANGTNFQNTVLVKCILREIGWGSMDWIHLAQSPVAGSGRLSRTTQLHGVHQSFNKTE
jgi:hypothetical protein